MEILTNEQVAEGSARYVCVERVDVVTLGVALIVWANAIDGLGRPAGFGTHNGQDAKNSK